MIKQMLAILLITILLSTNAYSGVSCNGTIDYLYMDKSGGVFVYGSWRQDYTKICDIDTATDWNGISGETCKGWLSLALAAKTAKQRVKIAYPDGAVCDALPTYNNSTGPNFILLKPDL